MQRLLNAARWDADEVRDDLREYVLEHLGDEASGRTHRGRDRLPQEGRRSRVGVARQYTGTAGDTVNCQVGVFLAYSSEKGAAFLDRALYLPRAWTNDPARRAEAGVPEGLLFRNKIELAKEMLERTFEAGVPARWVAGGFVLRSLARFQGVAGEAGTRLRGDGPEDQRRPARWAQEEDREARRAFGRRRLLGGATRAGCRRQTPVGVGLPGAAPDREKGMRRWLLVRRSTDEPEELGFYQAYGPEDTSIEELVKACQDRWAVEECFAEAKGEVGLDHYEVRRWDAWHRHVTLCLLAHAFLVVTRHKAAIEEEESRKKGVSTRADPSDGARGAPPGARYGRAAKGEGASCLGWSLWRRAHQAVAARCRAVRRSKRHAPVGEGRPRSPRSRPKRRTSPTSSGLWCVPCCRRKAAR